MGALDVIRERVDGEVGEEMSVDELGLDSLEYVELMQALDISDEAWMRVETVADLVREARQW